MDPPKTYTTDSFKDIKHKDTRLIRLLVLENYVAMYNKNPTEQEYWAYNSDWWNKKAKMRCKICDSIIIRDFLKKAPCNKAVSGRRKGFPKQVS